LFKVYTIYSLKYMGGHQNVYYKTVCFFFFWSKNDSIFCCSYASNLLL